MTNRADFKVYEFEGDWYYMPANGDDSQHYSEPCDTEAEAWGMVDAEIACEEEATIEEDPACLAANFRLRAWAWLRGSRMCA